MKAKLSYLKLLYAHMPNWNRYALLVSAFLAFFLESHETRHLLKIEMTFPLYLGASVISVAIATVLTIYNGKRIYDAVKIMSFPSEKVVSADKIHKAKALLSFRWFLPKSHRDSLDLAIADMHRDIKDMRKEKRSERFIRIYLIWHTTLNIVGVVRDLIGSSIIRMSPLSRLLNLFSVGSRPKNDE